MADETVPHAAFQEFAAEREEMVNLDLLRRDIRDERVLAAMRRVPRHALVPPGQRERAYQDTPLPIDCNQTISQPYIVACMSQALDLQGSERPPREISSLSLPEDPQPVQKTSRRSCRGGEVLCR